MNPKIKKDGFGNIILEMSPLKQVPLVALSIFSALTAVLLVYYMIASGGFSVGNIAKAVISTVIFALSLYSYLKREKFILTEEKLVCYRKWEVFYKDIETVSVFNKALGRFVEIKSEQGEFIVMQSDIAINADNFAKMLSDCAKNSRNKEKKSGGKK